MKTSSILLGLTLAAASVSAAPRFGGQAQQSKGAAASKGGAAAVSLFDLAGISLIIV